MEGRIDPNRPYGEHIPLNCVLHPDLRWSTKNIGGMWEGKIMFFRSLFFFGVATPDKPEGEQFPKDAKGEYIFPPPQECPCPIDYLRVVPLEETNG